MALSGHRERLRRPSCKHHSITSSLFSAIFKPMQKLFTGLQPSGALHIGNYFGVLKQTAEMLKDADGLVMVADYHALTTLKNHEQLRTNIIDVVRDYVAVG